MKLKDESLQNLEHQRLVSLINSMGDGVIAIDQDFKIVITNGAALNILDVNDTLIGKSIHQVLHLIDKTNQSINLKQQLMKTNTVLSTRDWRLVYQNEEAINMYLSISPVRLSYGQSGMNGYVLLLRDITREKSLEEERDEFISVVSHELRTPIAVAEGNVGNAIYLLEKNTNNEQLAPALQQAYDQIVFLSGMINDLATLSRAERGKLQVNTEAINVHQLVQELVSNYQPQAKIKKLIIESDVDPNLEILYTSKLYLREILQNFITNAIKYSSKGKIIIQANRDQQAVVFRVSDNGIGISKSDQNKVFDKFFRSEDYRTRQSSGTGLGLYITKKLAKLINAEISLESELDHGSTFSLKVSSLA